MIPIVGMKPDPLRTQPPFMLKRRAQQPRAQPLALGGCNEPKVLQLNLGQAALEFAQTERSTVAVSENVDLAARRLE